MTDSLLKEADEIADQDRNMAHFLRLCDPGLNSMAKFFVLLHHWVLEPRLTPSDDLVRMATILKLNLQALDRSPQAIAQRVHDRKQKLRTEHWQPAVRVIENLLRLLSDLHALEAGKILEAVHEVRAMLARL